MGDKDIKALQKQLTENSFDLIYQALESLVGCPDIINLLTQGVRVDPRTGGIDFGRTFRGSQATRKYRNVAIMGLLSMAEEGSPADRIRSSVRSLSLDTRRLPSLRGFTALEELEIIVDLSIHQSIITCAEDVYCFGEMPALKSLRIIPCDSFWLDTKYGLDTKDQPSECLHIKTLAGLQAPNLEFFESRIEHLSDISALSSSTKLKRIKISNSKELGDLSPIASLGLLEELEIAHLPMIRSLPPISALVSLTKLSIYWCVSDISELSTAPALQHFLYHGSGFDDGINLISGPAQWPKKLLTLELTETSLVEIGELPQCLMHIKINYNPLLQSLQGLSRCVSLVFGEYEEVVGWAWRPGRSEYESRARKKTLSLSTCSSLRSLDGLHAEDLQFIIIPWTLCNIEALAGCPDICICVDLTVGSYSTKLFPQSLATAMSGINLRHLVVRGGFNEETDIQCISTIKSLRSLDLSGSESQDLSVIVGLEDLEEVRVMKDSRLAKELKKSVFNTKGQINKLKMLALAGG
jgi:hypothetical protein